VRNQKAKARFRVWFENSIGYERQREFRSIAEAEAWRRNREVALGIGCLIRVERIKEGR